MAKTREEYRKGVDDLFAPVKRVGKAIKNEWNRSVENSKATRRITPTSTLNRPPVPTSTAPASASSTPPMTDILAPTARGTSTPSPNFSQDATGLRAGEPRTIRVRGNKGELFGDPFTDQQGVLKDGVHLGGQHFKSMAAMGEARASSTSQPAVGPEIRRDGHLLGSIGDVVSQYAELNRGRPSLQRDGAAAVFDFNQQTKMARQGMEKQLEDIFKARGANRDMARELAVQALKNEGYTEAAGINADSRAQSDEAALRRQELSGDQQMEIERLRQSGLSDRQAEELAVKEDKAFSDAVLETYNSLVENYDLLGDNSSLTEEQKDSYFNEAVQRVRKSRDLAQGARGLLNEETMPPPPPTDEELDGLNGENTQTQGGLFSVLTNPTRVQDQMMQMSNPLYWSSKNISNMFKK